MSDTKTGKVVWEPTVLSNNQRYFWRAEVNDGVMYHFAYFVTLDEAVTWCEEMGL